MAASTPSQFNGEAAHERLISSPPSTARGSVHDERRFNRLSRVQRIAAARRLGRIETRFSGQQPRSNITRQTGRSATSSIVNERVRRRVRRILARRAAEELRCQHHPPQDAEVCRIQTTVAQNLRDLENVLRWTNEQALQVAGSSSPRTQRLHPLEPYVNRSAMDELQGHINNVNRNLARWQQNSALQARNMWSRYQRIQGTVLHLRRQDERLALRLARYRHAEPGDLPCLWVPHDPLPETSQSSLHSAMARRQENLARDSAGLDAARQAILRRQILARESAGLRSARQNQIAAMMMDQLRASQRLRFDSVERDRRPLHSQPHAMTPPQHGHPTVHASIQSNSRLRAHLSQLQYTTNDPEEIPHSPESAVDLQSASASAGGDAAIRHLEVTHSTREHLRGATILGSGNQARTQTAHAQGAFMQAHGSHPISRQDALVASGAEAVTINHTQSRPRVYGVGDLRAMGTRLQVDTGPSVRNSLRETGAFDSLSEHASSRNVSRELRSPQAEAFRHLAWQGHSGARMVPGHAGPSQGPSPGSSGIENDPQTPVSQISNDAGGSRDNDWSESEFQARIQSRMQLPTQRYIQLHRHVT